MSTPEENKALVRRYVEEACIRGNLDIIDEVFSPGFVYRGVAPPAGVSAPEGYKRAVAAARAAFPDYHVTFEDMVAEGDLVAYHVTWSGTHLGEFRGIPPTGRRVSWQATCFRRVVDGKVVEGWGTYDWLAVLQQLGASPSGRGG
jgi:steroid delta-isomerase-like uncharacterized protein